MAIAKNVLLASILVFPLTVHGESLHEQCRSHFLHGRYDLAVPPCSVVAEQGDLDAQNWLGLIFTKGKGVPQDYVQAFKWKKLAAEQGDATGQYNLGRMYEQGLGVKQDYHEAIKWYKKAVAQGSSDAQYSIGSMYRKGKGVGQDDLQAYVWYSLAVEQGMFLAEEPKEKLESVLTAEQLERAKQLVEQLKTGN